MTSNDEETRYGMKLAQEKAAVVNAPVSTQGYESQRVETFNVGDAREIWELLSDSPNGLELYLSSDEELQQLRVKLHNIKARSEHQLVELGFMNKDEVQSILVVKRGNKIFHGEADGPVTKSIYHFLIGKRKREPSKYTFRII